MTYRDILKPQLEIDEGRRSKPYVDTVGKATIGVGRNLTDVGLRDDEIDVLLSNDMDAAEDTARRLVTSFDRLNDVRKAVVVNMAFNMGYGTLSQFTNMLRAIYEGRWDDAANAMLSSRWAQQVGARAQRLAEAMRTG